MGVLNLSIYCRSIIIDIEENLRWKMHGEFHCHWYENKGVVGIQMFVKDMTRINHVFPKKKSIGLNLSLNHILQHSIVPDNFRKSIKFDLKQLKHWFIENALSTRFQSCDGHYK